MGQEQVSFFLFVCGLLYSTFELASATGRRKGNEDREVVRKGLVAEVSRITYLSPP